MVSRAAKTMFVTVVGAILAITPASKVLSQSAGSRKAGSEAPAGTWVGAARVDGNLVPFQLEITGSADHIHAALINGKERSPATSAGYSDGHLTLEFNYYANTLDATLHDGTLTGSFSGRGRSIPLTAQWNARLPLADPHPPQIGGVWQVAVVNGAKGERSWKLRVRQAGARVNAVIERIDGDTGNLYGVWRDGAFTVSHFTAAGPSLAVLRPQPDGSLQVETSAHAGAVQSLTARRVSALQTISVQSTDDPLQHTFLKNPNQPLAFRFPDLNGRLISSTDPEFAHKVLIVGIGGSWCPNCQDEAPFLEQLYRKYHSQGLNIVEISFEEAAQLQNPVRLKAVMQRYGITYPVLLAGTPDQLSEKFPAVANLNCWPTTFFVGRDGLVKATHTGYAGPATISDNQELEKGITAQVEQLLADQTVKRHTRPVEVAKTQ
jgi:thiol-disulfide isomerase/thioredoxin